MTATPTQPAPPRLALVIAAASIGNALEWYDLLIYGYFAATMAKLFFPTSDPTVSLMLAFGTFGLSYFARPLGAIVLGAYADRAGRKAALTLSIFLMMIGTLATALMPPYAAIGVAAPIAILLARLLQGFSVGGEFGSSTAFLVEQRGDRRGFLASWQWFGQGMASALASAFGIGLTATLSSADLQAWGWRIPFLFGLLIGPVGLYLRRRVDEAPEFLKAKTTRTPVRDLLGRQADRLLLAMGAVIISTSANYLLLYMPTYAIRALGLPHTTGFIATLIGALILAVGSPFMGHWSDKVGRIRIMMVASALFLITAYPAFALLVAHASLAAIVLVVAWFALLKTAYSGVLPSLMAEMFPIETRGTGMSLSYNVAVPIFGGLSPLVATWLIRATGDNLAPSFYLMMTALVSLLVLVLARRHLRLG